MNKPQLIVLLGIKNAHLKQSMSEVKCSNKDTSMEGSSSNILDEDNDRRGNEA